jgi:hypothetical protein
MIPTKKAAAGFIILAAIVFLTAYFATPATGPSIQPASNLSSGDLKSPAKEVIQYRPPLISFKAQWETALVITATVELFTLICYIVLKKLESKINKAAENAMRNLREQNEEPHPEEE